MKFKDEACLQNNLGMVWNSDNDIMIVLNLIALSQMKTLIKLHVTAFFKTETYHTGIESLKIVMG